MSNLITQADAYVGTNLWSSVNRIANTTDAGSGSGQGALLSDNGSVGTYNEYITYVDASNISVKAFGAAHQAVAVTAGTVYQARVYVSTARLFGNSIGYMMISVEWQDSTGAYISNSWGQVPVESVGEMTVTAPVGATQARYAVMFNVQQSSTNVKFEFTNAYFGVYVPQDGEEPTPPPPAPEQATGLDVKMEIGTAGTNLVTNPSGEDGAHGWVSNLQSALVTTSGANDWTFLKMQAMSQQTTYYTSEPFPVDTTLDYTGIRLLWGGFTADTRVGVSVEWLDVNKAVLGSTSEVVVTPVANAEYERVVGGYASGTEYARIRLNQYRWLGSNAMPMSGDYFEFREATAKQSEVFEDVSGMTTEDSVSVAWLNIIEPTHEISIERDSVDVGLLSATVLKDEYDPAAGGIVKPGAAVRVMTLANGEWGNLFQGNINSVQTTYPKNAQTRIVLTASNAMNLLSNQYESRGVALISELPFLLADKGVKWSANGNANQVGTKTVVSTNDSASMFDQIVITRDSDKGYAWVDASNVLQVWNRSSMPTAPVVQFSDLAGSTASYSHIDMGFDTTQTINVVEISYLRYHQNEELEWVTDEIKYGPYIDADSLKAWGAYKSTFTIHGITETEANMQAFANEVLTKNATPTIKVNSITVPIRNEAERSQAAAIDLYSMVGVKYADKYDGDVRVVGIKHSIEPGKWIAEYTFEKGDSVAVPVWTPSVDA